MSNTFRLNKSLGKQVSEDSKALNTLQDKRAGKLSESTFGFSGIANSTRSLFRNILGNNVVSGASSNANLANLLSNKPGNSTSESRHALNSFEGSSCWADSISNALQLEATTENSLFQPSPGHVKQNPIIGPSLEDELTHFKNTIDTYNEEGGIFEDHCEDTLDVSLVPENTHIPSLVEGSIRTRFPLNNQLSLKSAPQVGLYVNNTEPLLVFPDKSITLSAEKTAYAWADEFLSHFNESLTGEPATKYNHSSLGTSCLEHSNDLNTTSSISQNYSNPILSNAGSLQSPMISQYNQRNFLDEDSSKADVNLESEEFHPFLDAVDSSTSAFLEDVIQSPKSFMSKQNVPSQNVMDLEKLEDAWPQVFGSDNLDPKESWIARDSLVGDASWRSSSSEYTDGADVIAFLNCDNFPEELLPSPLNVPIVNQSPKQATYDMNMNSEWSTEFNREEDKEINSLSWRTEYENHQLIEASEINDGADVVAFLNSKEFPEELLSQLDDVANLEEAWSESIAGKRVDLDWSREFGRNEPDKTLLTPKIMEETELQRTFNQVFKEAQIQINATGQHNLRGGGGKKFDTWNASVKESDGGDVVAFLNSSHFPKELLSVPEDLAAMEEAWNHSLEKEWPSEFVGNESEIDNAICDRLDSSLSVEQWLKEFEQKKTVKELPEMAFDLEHSRNVNDYYGGSMIDQKGMHSIEDGAEVVEFLSRGAFPFELTPDITDLDEISELEVRVAENWSNEFQQYNSDLDDPECETSEEWDRYFLHQPHLEEDVYSELSESRPPTPPDGFEVVAFLNDANFPTELITEIPEFSAYNPIKIRSIEEDSVNQSHLQRWLEEFEDSQTNPIKNPVADWVSEFSEIQDLIRQEIEHVGEINGKEASFVMLNNIPSSYSPKGHHLSAYHGNGCFEEGSDTYANWTNDFLQMELVTNFQSESGVNETIPSKPNILRSINLESSPNHDHMLDKKESIELTIKDLIKEIADEITAEEFFDNFDYQESFLKVPDTHIPTQTFDANNIKLTFPEITEPHSEVTRRNALDRLKLLRKHILG